MPLFLRTREPLQREKLILGGAIAYRNRSHRLRIPHYRRSIKMPSKLTTTTSITGTKPASRRRGVSTSRRRRAPLKQQRRRSKTIKRQPKKLQQTLKKALTKTGKRMLKKQLGRRSTTSAKQVLNQLAQSRQIQRAVKGVVAQGSDLPAAASAHLMRRIVNKRPRKRLAEEVEEELASEPTAKRSRLSPGYSRIGYRGKQIQRGGTKQQRGGTQFLF